MKRMLTASQYDVKEIMDILRLDDSLRDTPSFEDVRKLAEKFFRQLLDLDPVDYLIAPDLEELLFDLTGNSCIYELTQSISRRHSKISKIIIIPARIIVFSEN